MNKIAFFGLLVLFVLSSASWNRIDALGFCCFWSERYYNPNSGTEPYFYGYEDIYNYPYGYSIPVNYYFNPRPCRYRNGCNGPECYPRYAPRYNRCSPKCRCSPQCNCRR